MTYDPVRRSLLKVTAASVGIAPLLVRESLAQTLDPEAAERVLYPAKGLPGGGQMEVRMMVESEHPDPDIVELGHRVKPFNLESWYAEHSHVAEKNEKRAQAALAEGNKVTASEYFLRAAGFWRSAIIYLPEADDRMTKGYARLKETFDKAWSLVPPPFERVQIPTRARHCRGFSFPHARRRGARLRLSSTMAVPTAC
jgi:hypothetical protein